MKSRIALLVCMAIVFPASAGTSFVVRNSDFVNGVYQFHYYTFPNTAPTAVAKRTVINGADQGLSDPTLTRPGWEFGDPYTPGVGYWAAEGPFAATSTSGTITMGWDLSAVTVPISKIELRTGHFLFQFDQWLPHAAGDQIAGLVATPSAFGTGTFTPLYSFVGGTSTTTVGSGSILDITSSLPGAWLADPGLLELKFTYAQTPNPTIPGRHLQIFRDSSGAGTDGFLLRMTLASCVVTPGAPGAVASGITYDLSWTAAPASGYEIQEATSADFSNATTKTAQGTSQPFVHDVPLPTTYFYRVRPLSCGGTTPSFGPVAQTVVLPQQAPTSKAFDLIVPIGATAPVTQVIRFENETPGTTFTAVTDQPFIQVSPSSGTVPVSGRFDVTLVGDPRNLPAGSNTGTVILTLSTPGAAGGAASNGTTTVATPVSVSLVTPVAPTPKSAPPGDAILIPAVAHLEGSGARFQSDVRLTNANAAAGTYLLTFTPSNTDGTTAGRQTSITVQPQQTVALNDVLRGFFGFAQPGDSAGGTLEIRSASGSMGSTYVTSRTYATTAAGTYGQFIPAIPIAKFLKAGAGTLTLTQVSQGTAFRSNIGIVEGLGAAANGLLRVFNPSGQNVKDVPFSLRPFEFQQLNGLLALNGVPLDDARIEVLVNGGSGLVTAYASVLDNKTQDPLLVSPVQTSTLASGRYVLPGMADLILPTTNFHSDVRIFNPGPGAVTATLTYYPQGPGTTPAIRDITLQPGEIKAYDNVLPSLFGLTGTGGSIVVTTPGNTSMVVSGRTYSNAAGGGTFGQFIPAVIPADGIGTSGPPLQLLQLEQSQDFRTNIGINELTGNPVKVEVSLVLADAKSTASTTLDLQPNEFRQLNAITMLNPGKNTYNARVVVKVLEGTGRVTAYASVIDNDSLDPTYVPAQK